MVYLNHAATTHPRPPAVVSAVVAALSSAPVHPGRGAGGQDPLTEARLALAELLDVDGAERIALLPSATYALNLAIAGLAPQPGDHVVTTRLEHNSVLRPLAHSAAAGRLRVSYVSPDRLGRVSAEDVERALEPRTRLVAVTHVCNATGSIQPIREIAAAAAHRGVALLVDASQSAGVVPLGHRSLPGRVFIAFAGHKSLLGPPGVGGLVLADDRLPQGVVGGTGIRSEEPFHPPELPLRHEAGTPDVPAAAGLAAGVRLVLARGLAVEGARRGRLTTRLRSRLAATPGVSLSPELEPDPRAGIVAFRLAGWSPGDVGDALLRSFDIEVRTGLHCAPLLHEPLGTAPLGTVRASIGWSTTEADVDTLATAVEALAGGGV